MQGEKINKNMAPKVSGLLCFEAFGVICCPDCCSYFALYVGAGITCALLIIGRELSLVFCHAALHSETHGPWPTDASSRYHVVLNEISFNALVPVFFFWGRGRRRGTRPLRDLR